ncbi:uncharacterized protein [Physcomitrium patens]|uniref:uncharacterized protein n=1 Tax=Physcomitrium patens TaxID=3218 RepID=UPI003CCCC1D8
MELIFKSVVKAKGSGAKHRANGSKRTRKLMRMPTTQLGSARSSSIASSNSRRIILAAPTPIHHSRLHCPPRDGTHGTRKIVACPRCLGLNARRNVGPPEL